MLNEGLFVYVHVFPEIHNTYMSDDTAVVFLYIERRKNVMNSLKLSILQDGALAWLGFCSTTTAVFISLRWFVSTTASLLLVEMTLV